MVWDESEHPRDEKGKFTFKGGSDSSEVVLKGRIEKSDTDDNAEDSHFPETTKTEKERKYRNKLIYVLGDKLTREEILYSSIKELEEKAYELGIYISKNIPVLGKSVLSILGGPDAAGMLNIAEGKQVPVYTKNAIKIANIYDNKIYNYNNGILLKYIPAMEKKIKEQFKDFNYNLSDIDGYIFENNSAAVNRIKKSDEFKDIIYKNFNKISAGENFTGIFYKNKNLHNAFGKVDFYNAGIDKQNNLHLFIFDTYDYNKNESPKIEAGR